MSDYEKYKGIDVLPKKMPMIKSDENNPPKSDNFAVISPCFYKEDPEMVTHCRKQFEQEGINYITYGLGEKYTNKVYTNLIRLYSILDEIEVKYNEVLIMDAFDTLYVGGKTILTLISRMRNKLHKDPNALILASEKQCYPNGCEIFYNGKEYPKYLNSGFILGESGFIKVIIREMIHKYDLQRFEISNCSLNHSQIYWHRYFNDGKFRNNCYIDGDSQFFHCMDNCNPYQSLELINPINIKIKETNTNPKFFHFNRCFTDEYKHWFGEFWVETLVEKGFK